MLIKRKNSQVKNLRIKTRVSTMYASEAFVQTCKQKNNANQSIEISRLLNQLELTWKNLSQLEKTWVNLKKFASTWKTWVNLKKFESIWKNLNQLERTWVINLKKFESIWKNLNQLESKWSSLAIQTTRHVESHVDQNARERVSHCARVTWVIVRRDI